MENHLAMRNHQPLLALTTLAIAILDQLGSDPEHMRRQVKMWAPDAFSIDSLADKSPLNRYLLSLLPRGDRSFDPDADNYQNVLVQHPQYGPSTLRIEQGRFGADFIEISLPQHLVNFDLFAKPDREIFEAGSIDPDLHAMGVHTNCSHEVQ